MDDVRVVLKGSRKLDRPILFRCKGVEEQLLGESNGMSRHPQVQVIVGHCAAYWSLSSGHKCVPPSPPSIYFRGHFCIMAGIHGSAFMVFVYEKIKGSEGNYSPRCQSIGRIMRRTDLRE